VSESKRVNLGDLSIVGAALQKQVTRDLVQFWNVSATVDVFPRLENVPIGYWPIIIMDDIGFDAAGIHLDKNGQPFALVSASDEMDVWSLTTSHEIIEMLVDPLGNRLITGDSPKSDQTRVQFLIELCDPSEAAEFAYSVNGILVSDFYSVRFFDPFFASGVRYSFTGAIEEPRQVLRGGYLSWLDIASDTWWQETWFRGDSPTFRNLGQMSIENGSLRGQIDRMTFKETSEAVSRGRAVARAAGVSVRGMDGAMAARASSLRQQIEMITGQLSTPDGTAMTLEMHGGQKANGGPSPRGRTPRGAGQQTDGLRVVPSVLHEPSRAH